MNRDLIPQLEPLAEILRAWRGSLVEVVEQVARLPGTFDRHFTTTTQLVMKLEDVAITFSGGSLTLSGTTGSWPATYQATCERLEELSLGPREVVFLERFGQTAERRSVFRVLEEMAPEPSVGGG